MTYAELDERSNRLARALIRRGIGPEDTVALGFTRSVMSVLGALAVVKAGAAFVPTDPRYPAERIRHMVTDSGVRLGLATDALLRKAKRLNKQVHVWTVNDRRTLRRLLDRGVNGVITDQPELFLELRKEHDELGDAQKLLMACRHLLK